MIFLVERLEFLLTNKHKHPALTLTKWVLRIVLGFLWLLGHFSLLVAGGIPWCIAMAFAFFVCDTMWGWVWIHAVWPVVVGLAVIGLYIWLAVVLLDSNLGWA